MQSNCTKSLKDLTGGPFPVVIVPSPLTPKSNSNFKKIMLLNRTLGIE